MADTEPTFTSKGQWLAPKLGMVESVNTKGRGDNLMSEPSIKTPTSSVYMAQRPQLRQRPLTEMEQQIQLETLARLTGKTLKEAFLMMNQVRHGSSPGSPNADRHHPFAKLHGLKIVKAGLSEDEAEGLRSELASIGLNSLVLRDPMGIAEQSGQTPSKKNPISHPPEKGLASVSLYQIDHPSKKKPILHPPEAPPPHMSLKALQDKNRLEQNFKEGLLGDNDLGMPHDLEPSIEWDWGWPLKDMGFKSVTTLVIVAMAVITLLLSMTTQWVGDNLTILGHLKAGTYTTGAVPQDATTSKAPYSGRDAVAWLATKEKRKRSGGKNRTTWNLVKEDSAVSPFELQTDEGPILVRGRLGTLTLPAFGDSPRPWVRKSGPIRYNEWTLPAGQPNITLLGRPKDGAITPWGLVARDNLGATASWGLDIFIGTPQRWIDQTTSAVALGVLALLILFLTVLLLGGRYCLVLGRTLMVRHKNSIGTWGNTRSTSLGARELAAALRNIDIEGLDLSRAGMTWGKRVSLTVGAALPAAIFLSYLTFIAALVLPVFFDQTMLGATSHSLSALAIVVVTASSVALMRRYKAMSATWNGSSQASLSDALLQIISRLTSHIDPKKDVRIVWSKSPSKAEVGMMLYLEDKELRVKLKAFELPRRELLLESSIIMLQNKTSEAPPLKKKWFAHGTGWMSEDRRVGDVNVDIAMSVKQWVEERGARPRFGMLPHWKSPIRLEHAPPPPEGSTGRHHVELVSREEVATHLPSMLAKEKWRSDQKSAVAYFVAVGAVFALCAALTGAWIWSQEVPTKMSLVPVSLLPGIAYFFVPLMFRPRNRNVRLKKIGLTLRGDQLTLGRNNISLNESFRCVLTWQALAAEADLLGVELVPNVAGGPSARLRFSVPVAEIESLRLPRLDSHEPLLDAKAFHNVFWPAIRRAAEAHGQKIPWATKIVEAA